MVLKKYIVKKFFKYFLTISISLTLLFNSIDFFEKFVRIETTTGSQILHYIMLNLIPSFFYYLPVNSWIASILLIRELEQQGEWQILPILNISYKKILNILIGIGLFLALTCFVGKEYVSIKLENKANNYKNHYIKKQLTQKILNKWFVLPNNTYCYFNSLNLKHGEGNGITILSLNKNYTPRKTIFGNNFHLNYDSQTININEASIYKFKSNKIKLKNTKIKLPAIFPHLELSYQTPNIGQITKTIISSKNIISEKDWNEILHKLLQRLLSNFQPILYIILGFCLFLLFPFKPQYGLMASLIPYPIMVFLNTIVDFIYPSTNIAWLAILPYLFLIFLFLFTKKKTII